MSIASALFFLLFLIIGLTILTIGLHGWQSARRAALWPTTPGTLLTCEMEVDTDSDGVSYCVKVNYAYQVRGRRYESSRLAIGYGSSAERSSHEPLLAKLQAARGVDVHYDPARPEHAVLGGVLTKGTMVMILFGALWTGMTVGLASLSLLLGHADTQLIESLILQ